MDMSASCTAPIHAAIKDSDKQHPRFGDYLTYRAAMSRQLVTCGSFESWLRGVEEYENGRRIVYQVTGDKAKLAKGWYVNVFLPRRTNPITRGPFLTESEAHRA